MLFVGMFTLIGQLVSSGASPIEALPGMLLIMLIAMAALLLKTLVPLQFPAFAWATLIAFILTIPMMPTSTFLLEQINKVGFSLPRPPSWPSPVSRSGTRSASSRRSPGSW